MEIFLFVFAFQRRLYSDVLGCAQILQWKRSVSRKKFIFSAKSLLSQR